MRLVLHQIAQDVRLLKREAAAWLVVVAAANALVIVSSSWWFPATEVVRRVDFAVFLLDAIAACLLVVVAVLLVQHDSPVTTTAFWQTRPLPPTALVLAKLLLALPLLVLVPLAWDAIDLAAVGLSPVWLPKASIAIAVPWVFFTMAIGAITTSLPQFFLIATFEVVVFGALSAIAWTLGFRWAPTNDLLPVAVGTTVMSLCLLAFAYFARRARTSWAVAGVAPIALFAILVVVSPPPVPPDEYRRPYSANVNVSVDRSGITLEPWGRASVIAVPVAVEGLGPAIMPWGNWAGECFLETRAGRVALQPLSIGTREGAAHDTSVRRFFSPLLGGGITLLNPSGLRSTDVRFRLAVPASEIDRYGREEATLRLPSALNFSQWRVVGTMPAQSAVALRLDGVTLRTGDVRVAGSRVAVMLREARAVSRDSSGTFSFLTYMLRNRAAGEAVAMKYGRTASDYRRGALSFVLPLFHDITTNELELQFALDSSPAARATGVSAWLKNAELLVIEQRLLGVRKVQLDVPHLRLFDLPRPASSEPNR
ncbi:MAG: hypothetical protein ACM3NQ_07970 [Bacteroidales bacterium]